MLELFGVKFYPVKKKALKSNIKKLLPNAKHSLWFAYSEFFLKSLKNKNYNNIINKANYIGIDGKGSLWAIDYMNHPGFLQKIYFKAKSILPTLLNLILKYLFILLEIVRTFFSFPVYILTKKYKNKSYLPELILGRDFVFELLTIANNKNWKISIVGGGNLNQVIQRLTLKYPKINFQKIAFEQDSKIMKDLWNQSKIDSITKINLTNLELAFEEVLLIKTELQKYQPDIILLALGGLSGKQELCMEYLKQSDFDFRLVAGIGAAFDHLGGGLKQARVPKILENFGLESFFRLLTNPLRRSRILNSIFGIWLITITESF
jgi:exopolysaccharide biosynthesis WecB/TagA/CpsF family protein